MSTIPLIGGVRINPQLIVVDQALPDPGFAQLVRTAVDKTTRMFLRVADNTVVTLVWDRGDEKLVQTYVHSQYYGPGGAEENAYSLGDHFVMAFLGLWTSFWNVRKGETFNNGQGVLFKPGEPFCAYSVHLDMTRNFIRVGFE